MEIVKGGQWEYRDDSRGICDIFDLACDLPQSEGRSWRTGTLDGDDDSGAHSLASSRSCSTDGLGHHCLSSSAKKLHGYEDAEMALSCSFSSSCSIRSIEDLVADVKNRRSKNEQDSPDPRPDSPASCYSTSSLQLPPYLTDHCPRSGNKQDSPYPRPDSPASCYSTSSLQLPPYLSLYDARTSVKCYKANCKRKRPVCRWDLSAALRSISARTKLPKVGLSLAKRDRW